GGSPGRAGVARPGIVINEILANTSAEGASDGIELLNISDSSIDISGWWLSDAIGTFNKFQIPANTILGSGQFIAFDESQFNADPDRGFALSGSNGDDLWLTVADSNGNLQWIVDEAHFLPSLDGEPFGRDAMGHLTPLTGFTPGATNADPRVGPVVITEVMYSPALPTAAELAIDPTLDARDLEYVEILNPTDATVDLTDWRIRGGIDYNFAPGDSVAAQGVFLLLRFDPNSAANANKLSAFVAHYGLSAGNVKMYGGYQGSLSNSGERITLLSTDLSQIGQPTALPRVQQDEVIYDDRLPWPTDAEGTGNSLQRVAPGLYGNDGQSWKAAVASPGRATFAAVIGDFDGDGQTNVTDITLLFNELQSPTPDGSRFDLNADGVINEADRDILVLDIIGTTYGDADLDYVFDSRDFVRLFQIGEYEDGIPNNSTWDEGDWNGDGEFDSADLTLAAQHNGYVILRDTAAAKSPINDASPVKDVAAALDSSSDAPLSTSLSDSSEEQFNVAGDATPVQGKQMLLGDSAVTDLPDARDGLLVDAASSIADSDELDDDLLGDLASDGRLRKI
ncbi:MAG: lamin tail domain-containing protein, partial [Planctomycetales bacterium]|nr:lamin tail domain-containing protein [Planctomycetales bacterium]